MIPGTVDHSTVHRYVNQMVFAAEKALGYLKYEGRELV
jgi:hypothetical protein